MKPLFQLTILTFFLFLQGLHYSAQAQTKVLKGIIKDKHSDERVPFASVQFQQTGIGKLADSSGSFLFQFVNWPKDSLLITSVGFQDYAVLLDPSMAKNDTIQLSALMEPGRYNIGVVV